jgi:hypothetical protein
MGKVLAAALLVLALAGCTAVGPPPSGFSPRQWNERHELELDLSWQRTGLADSLRPPAPDTVAISPEEWAEAFATCMNDAGFDNYQAQGSGVMITEVSQTPEVADAQSIARYTCDASFRIAGYEGYNDAEIDYLYDYYRDELIPCLALHLVEIAPRDVPTRQQFSEFFGGWNPYGAVTPGSQKVLFSDASIADECPDSPPGIDSQGWSDAYE